MQPDWGNTALPYAWAYSDYALARIIGAIKFLSERNNFGLEQATATLSHISELIRQEQHFPTLAHQSAFLAAPPAMLLRPAIEHPSNNNEFIQRHWPLTAYRDSYPLIAEVYRTSERKTVKQLLETLANTGRYRIGYKDGRLSPEVLEKIDVGRIQPLIEAAIDEEADLLATLPESLEGPGWRHRVRGENMDWVPDFLRNSMNFDDGITLVFGRLDREEANEILAKSLTLLRRNNLHQKTNMFLRNDAERRVLNLAGVLYLRFKRGEHLPDHLQDVAGELGENVIQDLDGQLLRYSLDGDGAGFSVYSVGSDLSDDGGRDEERSLSRDTVIHVSLDADRKRRSRE
ncbi:MAG: hypothetical protein F6J97_25800 [Leptolyngbya sp. SIO4C1]|nr:hypothetical protein [Leptolyngbya sp. SIO4C1]